MKVKIYFFSIVAMLGLYLMLAPSCTDKKGATKALERNNYKPIDVGGYDWFGGGKDDVYRTNFKAIAPNGDTVTGCVTSGWFKGNTIRLDD
jgi:hypothetical protein